MLFLVFLINDILSAYCNLFYYSPLNILSIPFYYFELEFKHNINEYGEKGLPTINIYLVGNI